MLAGLSYHAPSIDQGASPQEFPYCVELWPLSDPDGDDWRCYLVKSLADAKQVAAHFAAQHGACIGMWQVDSYQPID